MKNFNYKCPYCLSDVKKTTGFKFDSWKSVRKHVAKCIDNINSYVICENYGPIKYEEINSFASLQDFKRKYPNLSFKSGFWEDQRKKNRVSIKLKHFSKEEVISLIKDYVKLYGVIPQCRDFRHSSLYPHDSTVANLFGSWNTAIEVAGFKANTDYGYGVNTFGIDGTLYRSKVEAYFADNYLYNKYSYEYEKPYGNGWYYDFYIKELDLYVEITAGLNPDRIQEKIIFNNRHNRKFKVIKYEEVYKKQFSLQDVASLDSHKIEDSDSISD